MLVDIFFVQVSNSRYMGDTCPHAHSTNESGIFQMQNYLKKPHDGKFQTKNLRGMKKNTNFALAFVESNILRPRRDGRVVDCIGLENRRTERYQGFESLSLRNIT